MIEINDYSILFQYSPLPKLVYDSESLQIVDVNLAALEVYGYSRDEFLIMTIKQLRPNSEMPNLLTALSKWDTQIGRVHFGISTHLKKNGELIRMDISGHKLKLNDRSYVLVVCQDVTEKENRLLELEESERKLKNATSIAHLGYWKLEIDSQTLYWSDEVYKVWGLNQDNFELNYDNFFETIHPEEKDLFQKEHTAAFKGEHEHNFIHRILKPDGSVRWVHQLGKLERDEEGDPIAFEGTVQDITSQKEAEQERNNLQATLESSLNEIYIFDSETLQFSYVNKGALLNLGYSEQEIKTLTPLDLKPDFTEISFKQLITPLASNEKQKIVFLTKHQRKDGSLYPVEVHLQLVGDNDYKRFLAIILDISERKKAEQSILLANERFQKVTEATNDAIWDWDIVSETFYCSKAIERLFGEDTIKLITAESIWNDFIHLEDISKVKKSLFNAMADPKCSRWELEYRILNKKKKSLNIIDRGVIIRNNEGKAIRLVGAKTDITDRKRNEEELIKLNKVLNNYTRELELTNGQLEQFAFIASHDLQEPLRMITSFLNQLERKYGDQLDEKAQEYIFFATDGAKRMQQIILDLLKFYSAGKLENSQESLNLNDLIDEYSILRKKVISEKSVIIKTNNLPSVLANKTPLTQTLHCILDNAIKYSKKHVPPIIEITVIEKKDAWLFTISDNGIGVEPQFYEKIFIAFQRLHNREDYEGTGIGLSIAKKNVDTWGGKIWMDSILNEGSTFYFTLKKY
jgi:PAS domain S-box-containing protein